MEFQDAYAKAMQMPARQRVAKPTAEDRHVQRVERSLRNSLRKARQRAKRKGLECSLDETTLLEFARRADFRCALTGVRFYSNRFGKNSRATRPSIDRIDCAKGYSPENVRVVLYAVNVMLADWGEQVVSTLARAFAIKRAKRIAAEVNLARTVHAHKKCPTPTKQKPSNEFKEIQAEH